jgi:hypothetical protein
VAGVLAFHDNDTLLDDLPVDANPAGTDGVPVHGTVLLTVTFTLLLVAVLPALSVACAVMMCVPFAVPAEFHEKLYGLVVSVLTAVPSTMNFTDAIPDASEAVALKLTLPLTDALLLGAVIETVGGVESPEAQESPVPVGVQVVSDAKITRSTLTPALVPTSLSVWLPADKLMVFGVAVAPF